MNFGVSVSRLAIAVNGSMETGREQKKAYCFPHCIGKITQVTFVESVRYTNST